MSEKKRLVFATANTHKVEEVRAILGSDYEIVSLSDLGCEEELPETSDTLEGNALQKARRVKGLYGMDCFADDTGLIVDSLGGEPGVRSARYAGPGHDSEANIALLLERLAPYVDRRARFMTVIALIEGESEHLFRGMVEGEILTERCGSEGFGYDPIFRPEGWNCSFAQMTPDEKNSISHRGRATAALAAYLKNNR